MASCWHLCTVLIAGPWGPMGSEARERGGTAVADSTPCSRHVLRGTATQMAHISPCCSKPRSPRLPSPCRVRNGLELTYTWRRSQIKVGVIGIEGSDGSVFRVSLHFYWKPGMCGRMRQWYVNSWRYWLLYAQSGQIILNVMGQMEAQVATG